MESFNLLDQIQRAPVMSAAEFLRARGHRVKEQDIPGLYRVNGGPELTLGQLRQLAEAQDVVARP